MAASTALPVENQDLWLTSNQSLRMDANSDLFPEARRKFHLERYEFAASYCVDKEVLDGACGTGYGASILGGTAKRVVGIDLADDAISYATKTYARPHVSFQRSFVELTPFESSTFDVVASFETVEHTLCPQSHMMEIARLLKPNGTAILSVPNRWGFTDHHFFDFDFQMFRKVVEAFFGGAEFYYQNPASHPGLPGIGPLVNDAADQAQCILAVCTAPRKEKIAADRLENVMEEIYRNAFARHNEYRGLAYKQNTSLLRRVVNKLRATMG